MQQQNLISFVDLSSLLKNDISYRELQVFFAKRKKNGLDKFVVQIGNRLFIDEDEFLKWFERYEKSRYYP